MFIDVIAGVLSRFRGRRTGARLATAVILAAVATVAAFDAAAWHVPTGEVGVADEQNAPLAVEHETARAEGRGAAKSPPRAKDRRDERFESDAPGAHVVN